MARNQVMAGEFLHKRVKVALGGKVVIDCGFRKKHPLDKTTVESYELITEEHQKSAASGIARGLVGGALLGPVGLLAGLTAKTKGTHVLAVQFKDGTKSLLEIDDTIYKLFLQSMF